MDKASEAGVWRSELSKWRIISGVIAGSWKFANIFNTDRLTAVDPLIFLVRSHLLQITDT